MPLPSASACPAETGECSNPQNGIFAPMAAYPCGMGAITMEEYYPVYFGKEQAGKVQVIRQGLYCRFQCRCRLTGDVVCRLHVRCGDRWESLGVVVPMDGGFGLDTRLPAKRLGEGELAFQLLPKHETPLAGKFVPISPEEPFAYIARLKESFLVRQGEQVGIVIRDCDV